MVNPICHFRSACAICSLLLLCLHLLSPASAQQIDLLDKYKAITLQIAVVLSEKSSPTMLACTLYNGSQQEFLTTQPTTGISQIKVIKPDDKTDFAGGIRDAMYQAPIKPGEMRTWYVNLSRQMGFYTLVDPGVYQIYWQIEQADKNYPLYSIKSNTLTLIKGKEKLPPEPSVVAPQQLAFVLSSDPLMLAVTRRNTGEGDLPMEGLLTPANRLVVVTPDGVRVDECAAGAAAETATVRPGESRTWRVDARTLLNQERYRLSGIYQVYWVYTTTDAEGKAQEHASTPLLFLKEPQPAQ